ncbi:hypothetical protein N657DRAFT_676049 [Parathielavia appendiculata]|uniref:Pre-mRNA splicing factor CLF1 n=1 Tax=Parathielavia appendiculata TaxID=2587402 RepID=A0AAN6U8T0_9PEZI|nr:hypothetical protein N657DRAFT_676049 [Parathielavia appendiculata]
MPLPQPKTALNNACSVIFNNTLYTYSADAFQSLRLEAGAEWEELPQGEKVTGAVCVGSTTGTASTSAFFVVGGVGGTDQYQGLQKYTYATGQWEMIKPESKVTHQRLGHGAVYINSTDSILVYGGIQDGYEAASSQTYTIGASAPHAVRSDDSWGVPLLKPILLPWSASEAVMVGGSTTNTNVMLFNAAAARWVDSGASLASPLLKDISSIQAVLLTGDDGSKNLITFDMSESPNSVKRTVLYSGPGIPVPNAAPVRKRTPRRNNHGSHGKERRDGQPLTVDNWPAYNSTYAPKATRSNFALAQGPDGMVVAAGGNHEDVLCMFNARQNSWEDAELRLGQFRLLSAESSSTSSSTTATSTTLSSSTSMASFTSVSASSTVTGVTQPTAIATGAAVAAVSGDSGPPLNTILGAVLGSFFGLAVLLALLYLCIRRRKQRQAHMEAGHNRRASGVSSNEKGGTGFAKDSLAFGQVSPGVFRGHHPQGSRGSFSSIAILMGRVGKPRSSDESRRDSSDDNFRAFKSTISKPMPQTTVIPVSALRTPQSLQQTRDEKGVAFAASTAEPKPRNLTTAADKEGATRRSSGWNRYWSGGSALNLLGFGSGNGNNSNNNNNNAATNNSQRTTLGSDDQSSNYSNKNRMTQDSATVPPLFPAAAAEPRLSLSRVTAHSPTIAVYSDKLMMEGLSGQVETLRPVSAVSDMSASAYSSGIPESVQEAWDPTAAHKPWGADKALNDSYAAIYTTPLAPASQGLRPPAPAPLRPAPQSRQQAPVRDDMSWLNLGAN